jgi:CheY-like chemotaxis protein
MPRGWEVYMTVIVVDDDDDTRETLCQMLHDEGYATAQASNGREALELLHAARQRPDLILLDLMMPEMDGWEFLMGLDEDPAFRHIPVALMSAHPSVRRAFEKEGDDYAPLRLLLPKPLDMKRLLAIVRRVCRRLPRPDSSRGLN